jgi:hypothetical protein
MNKLKSIIIAIFTLLAISAFSQPEFPANAPVFDSSVVARIDITINPDTLQWLYENVESNIEFHAVFKFNNGTINETVDNIGFRLRGNTSRYSQKKSFKVSFNTFVLGGKFYGMEKMNLNGEHNDPSIIRSHLSWEWLREDSIPAPRTAYSRVYINGDYFGLYIIVEHVDEEFIQSRYRNNDGNLYMCLYPADLTYLGSNPDLYKFTSGDRRAYELKTNTDFDDYSDLANFIDVLNNTPLGDLECRLQEIFNLNSYLKVMALDVVTGNWDGYIYNKNNFYLYHNTETDKFEYLPYDLDNTFGIDWFNVDWGIKNIYNWAPSAPEVRPLYSRLLQVPAIRDRYSFYMKQFLEKLANEDSLFAAIDQARDMIGLSVVSDPYYPLDYGYTYADFLNSYNTALGDHVKYGLKPFIQARAASANSQLVLNDISPALSFIESSRAKPNEQYWVRVFVEDEDASPDVQLVYQVNSGTVQYKNMHDDGTHHDHEAGDGFYGCEFDGFQYGQTLSWQVSAKDDHNHTTLLPCAPLVYSFHESTDPQLFINELIGDNDTTIADEYGEYDNWCEIYNGDNEPVWLGDKYLSDNLTNENKFKLPDVTMQPGTFLLIWTDGQPGQGPFHAPFKLNDEGEVLAIFDNETTGYYLIDSVSWSMQTIDITYGRETDGGLPWVFFTHPTPGYSNVASFIPGGNVEHRIGYFYPNPVKEGTIYFKAPFSGMLTDELGRIIRKVEKSSEIDARNLPPGMYFLRDIDGYSSKVIIW